ncbi:MAG: transposase [Patescibacteria group bacterium]
MSAQKNHPNRKPQRLKQFDYSTDGAYFVTICTHDRQSAFGEIQNGAMILNACGEIVHEQWEWLGAQYPYLALDEFCVMPNHFHGIVMIDNLGLMGDCRVGNGCPVGNGFKPFPTHTPVIRPTKHHGLSEIIRGFKTFSSRRINKSVGDTLTKFHWQKSFHDHIVRDEDELNRIRHEVAPLGGLHHPKSPKLRGGQK